MTHKAPKVKAVAAAGVSAPDAIKAALPMQLNEFARLHGFARTAVSMCIHGRQRHDRVRDALAEELGVSREWLDELIDGPKAPAAEAGGAPKVA